MIRRYNDEMHNRTQLVIMIKINISYISMCKADTMRGDILSNVIRIFAPSHTYLSPFIKLLINHRIKQSSSILGHCYFIGIRKKLIMIISISEIILSNFTAVFLSFYFNKIIFLDYFYYIAIFFIFLINTSKFHIFFLK